MYSLYEDNGCLGAVPGQHISAGSSGLPTAGTLPGKVIAVDIDAGWFGPVRISYCSQQMKHGRSSHWAWVAIKAEKPSLRPAISN